MTLDKDMLLADFGPQDLYRGRQYYRERRVGELEITELGDSIRIQTTVHGTSEYRVKLSIRDGYLHGFCNCPRYADGYYCKHMAAVLLRYLDTCSKPQNQPAIRMAQPQGSDASANRFLRAYLQNEAQPELPGEPVRLEPVIQFDEINNYPSFRFRIGNEKMYLIKNIQELAEHVYRQDTVQYGKNLSFAHTMESFTPEAQSLLRIILDMFPRLRTNRLSNWRHDPGSPLEFDKRWIRFDGESFEQIFDLLSGQNVPHESGKSAYRFVEGNPELLADLQTRNQGAVLSFTRGAYLSFFGNQFHLYAVQDLTVYRCTEDYAKAVLPFAEALTREMFFSQQDLPALSDCIRSLPENVIQLEDPENLLASYAPDDCIGCYYLDYDSYNGLTASVQYRYGDRLLPPGSGAKDYGEIRRNEKQERKLLRPLEIIFDGRLSNGCYCIMDEEAALDFLCDRLSELQELGEVYLSDRLQQKRISGNERPAVGISVSDGLLTLDLDTGEFPAEELEALYESLLKRRKYHLLQDGRYLPLTGSGYEKMAELVHMTQLKAKDMKSGHVKLPAYRSLYLNCVLENSEGIQVSRNQEFRQLVRSFRSVEDSDYQIPENLHGCLRPYQETGYRWMKTLEHSGFGGILADEMGLGKTVQVITYLLTVPRRETGKPGLIVCPASLVINWADELEKFAPDLQTLVLLGTAKERKQQLEDDTSADVYITSYDLLKRDLSLYEDKYFYACILDEGQAVKNQSTQGSKAVKQIRCDQRFVLTGTPIENRLSELWNLFDFLMPGYLFSHTAFVQRLEKPIVHSGNPDARRQLGLLIQPFLLRRRKADVLQELPPKIFHIQRIQLSEQERKTYQAETHHAMTLAEETQDSVQILALLTRLRQICCDPSLCFQNYEGNSSKLEACLELCRSQVANGHQILLFSQFTSMLDRIRDGLDQSHISSFTLVGATPKEKRARLVKDFNAGKASVFLISLKAGGTGLNLTAADVVIHYDPWWNQAAQDQATDRAHRIGQQHTVQVYKLIAKDTIEEKILRLQEKKAALLDSVTNPGDAQPLTREEILELLR